ncbi:MAG: cytochrome C [Nitrospirae bacterium]|nr:cytochrome C [Nitrospirota bacterium]
MGDMGVRWKRGFFFVFCLIISVFIFSYYLSGQQGTVNAQPKDSCVTDKCHSKMGKDKFVHGPVAVGECHVCHKGEADKHRSSPASNKFAPIKDVGQLCYKCHDRVDTMRTVHPPVKEGNCTNCHSPHQSPYKFQLRADGQNLCFMCHDKKIASGKFVHGPVAVGGCSMCHNPHQTDFPKMLKAADNDVCFTCHTDKAEALKGKKFVHKPAGEKCVNCHSPHAGDYKYNLKVDGTRDLCFGCHKDKKEWVANVKTKHGGLDTERHCLVCHDPHVSDYVKQLVKAPMDVCLTCHDKSLDTPSGKILDMKTYLAKNHDWHGPIKQKDCSACHNTHGSDNFRILRKYFPPVFYAPFDLKNYELCFNCHEKTLVIDPKTTTLTGFRNGEQNLHFKHVNKPDKGRTCRACHDVHATNNPKHIRDAVPFGAWGLPINHKKTNTGGSCSPGCHQTFSYDRTNPVKNR